MFTVLYRDIGQSIDDVPKAYVCTAKDYDTAEDACIAARPGCDVVWIVQTDNVHKAYLDYWGVD